MTRRRAQGAGTLFAWKRRNEAGEMVQVGWCAMVDQGRDADGKRKRKTIYAKTQREVTERLNDALREQQRGSLPKAGRLNVEQWLRRWLESVEGSVRPRTLEHYTWIAERICTAIGRKPLAKLEPSDVERMLAAMQKKAPDGPGLSARTAHHVRSVLRNALRKANRDGLVSRNVAALADPVRVPKHEMRTLAPDEVTKYLAAAAGDRLEALLVTALGMGMREGELMGLRWSCVDLEAGVLRVTHALQHQGGKPVLVEPKSEASRRSMPLPVPVAEALRQHRVRQAQEQLAAKTWANDMGLVFTTKYGGPLESTAVLRAHWSVLKAAGIPRMRFHDLRHSTATLLLEAGVPVKVVAEVLGHSSWSTTQTTYMHVTAGLRAQATAAQARILGG